MTSQSAGAQWLRNPNSGFARPRNHPLSQQTPRSVPWQATVEFTGGTVGQNVTEPAVKKQKLDEKRNTTGSNVLESGTDSSTPNFAAGSVEEKISIDIPARDTPSWPSGSTSEHNQVDARTRRDPVLPVRPGNGRVYPVGAEASKGPRFKEAVRTKPYVAEPPSSTPRYQEEVPADFFPWTRNHPEDILNELTTKQGYFDKVQGSQTESSTARPSVWSSLKHKSGLQILSSLFVSALDQRQAHGVVTANSTFKPPPRVTLTDTKREAWLRDLANSSIPLRRLSRTIPHGIRGKVLLDHCLAKQIPTSRAIWLAKCVGANEIRAFKRKGASGAFAIGGETKWIKDWTASVEQFLEMIIAQCGTPEWRSRINYGLRLITQFFSERLIDQEHYIDWLVSSTHASDLDSIPIWLLVIQIHWKEILEHRQRGRRLAEAILDQLYTVNQKPEKGIFASVEQELVRILKSLVVTAPACLLVPEHWTKYERLVRGYFQHQRDVAASDFDLVSRRNARLARAHVGRGSHKMSSPKENLIALLDGAINWASLIKSADECLTAADNSDILVVTCLEWASSLYRHGQARVYVAARVLRRWSQRGYELERPILDSFANNAGLARLNKGNIYRLLAELIRSRHFLVGKYFQWLIARGTLSKCGRPSRDGPCDARLLFELPLHGLPKPILNLRRKLLSSVGASVAEENSVIISVKAWICRHIPGIFVVPDGMTDQGLYNWDKAQLSQTVKSDVSRWIRQAIASPFISACNTNSLSQIEDSTLMGHKPGAELSNLITLEQYHRVQLVLEDMEDFAIMADVLRILSDSTDDLILTAITDTINGHFDTLAAIGAVDDLFQILWQQYQALNNRKRIEKCFVESLTDLGVRLPKAVQEVRSLRRRLLLYEQTIAVAACSPISDHMAEALQSAESTFSDETDQLMASGTCMDKQVLSQVFQTIVKRLEFSWHGPAEPAVDFGQLLIRLRSFGPKTFDLLISGWLEDILRSTSRPSLGTILTPLICTNALTLDLVLTRTVALLQGTWPPNKQTEIVIDVLDLLTLEELEYPPPMAYRQYRFRAQQQQTVAASASFVVVLIRAVVNACAGKEAPCAKAQAFIAGSRFRTLIQSLMLKGGETVSEISSAFDTGSSVQQIQTVIDSIIYPFDQQFVSDRDFQSQISKILENVCDFNFPLCRLKLRTAFGAAGTNADNATLILMIILLHTTKPSSNDESFHYWPTLVAGLTADQASHVREEAESELVSDIYREADVNPMHRKRLTEILVSVVEATAFSISDHGSSSMIAQIADRLNALLSSPQLSTEQPSTAILSADTTKQVLLQQSYDFVGMVLRLLLVHRPNLQHPKFSQIILGRLLVALSLLLIHPVMASHLTLPSYIFDTLALLTDLQSEETRSRCIRTLRDHHRTKDPRLLFLFGYSESIENEWLQLLTTATSTACESKAGGAGPVSTPLATSTTMQPFALRRWEMMQDATPMVTENDTSLSLTLFGARKAVL